MGESLVEATNFENKMRESVASGATLEVSVSFGRFENDSLSWEKWSSFSPNKYLEEVEKCSTPGSVAQKKAYFEAHYKKIAARKAEQLEQEKQVETCQSTKDDQHGIDHAEVTPAIETELGMANGQSSTNGIEQSVDPIVVMSSSQCESSEDAAFTVECLNSSDIGAEEEVDSAPHSLDLNKSGVSLVQGDARPNETQQKVDLQPVLVEGDAELDRSGVKVELPMNMEEREKASENGKANVKSNVLNKSIKMSHSKKGKSLAVTKKKLASPLPTKSPEVATPKTSKPTSASPMMTTSRSSTKKATTSSSSRSKNLSAGESKKVAPSSLHMSLSLGPTDSGSVSLNTTRKSLIMEKMADKDIVKRAFKTFQNNFNQLRVSNDDKLSGWKEVSTTRPEQKLSTSLTSRKENAGIRKASEKMDTQRAQLGRSWNATSAGSLKGASMDQRKVKPAPSSFGLRSDERAENRKEFLKKLEAKSHAKEAEKTQLSLKSREEKEAEIKKLRQSLNFKATPLPGFYRGHVMPKSALDKEGAKKECWPTDKHK